MGGVTMHSYTHNGKQHRLQSRLPPQPSVTFKDMENGCDYEGILVSRQRDSMLTFPLRMEDISTYCTWLGNKHEVLK